MKYPCYFQVFKTVDDSGHKELTFETVDEDEAINFAKDLIERRGFAANVTKTMRD